MDTRKYTIAYTFQKSVLPYFVECKNTENWNLMAGFITYDEAHEYIVRMMDEYPTVPWRILVHRPRARRAA